MYEHYLKTSLRNFWRYRGYTLINMLGLATGIATCLIIFTYISHELSYDKFHENYEDVYRVAVKGRFAEDFFNVACSMPPIGPALKEKFPEVMAYTRIDKFQNNPFLAYEDIKFYEDGLYFADSAFLEVFTFEMINGDPATALVEPNCIVLTERIADKYFENENPVGKVLRLNDQVNMKVTGVLKEIPENTHLKFSMIGSISTVNGRLGREPMDENWGSLFLHNYIRLYPGTGEADFGEKIRYVIKDAFGEAAETYNIEMIPYLQPLASIHLYSNLMAELEPGSDISYIYIFAAVALFILIIACINFMNLTTARSTKRSREVGMRKVAGATRKQLIGQFLSESMLISLLCMVFAFITAEAVLPFFSDLTGLNLEPWFHSPVIIPVILGLGLFVGVFAGAYPAFILSSFQPIRAIRGELYRGMKKSVLRNLLVVLQFAISIAMLVSTWLIYKQMNYIGQKKLGYDQENVVIIPLKSERLRERGQLLKAEFGNLPAVSLASLTSSIPGEGLDGRGFSPEGIDSKSPWILYTVRADVDLVDVLGMKIKEGRKLSRDYGTDSTAAVINETLVKKLGWDDPIGKKIYDFGQGDSARTFFTVVGVAEDYHFKSLHDPIEPSIIYINREDAPFLALKLHPGNTEAAIEQLRLKWEEVESAFPFDYFFMKEQYGDLYKREQKMAGLFITFTVLAMVIACLGLFGLALFSIEQRTKEIGIRKILGSSVFSIMYRLSLEFSKWIVVASVIAWPVAWLLVDKWLQSFAYRIEILHFAWIFIASAVIALVIAQTTILYHAYRAATRNPVDAVKWE
ncbi:MAG: ABC transporter permease [Bacteroidales bacterium]|nr:ABC transporter permease [Bacteroidales bacterium]